MEESKQAGQRSDDGTNIDPAGSEGQINELMGEGKEQAEDNAGEGDEDIVSEEEESEIASSEVIEEED